jgi:hypothetical protein
MIQTFPRLRKPPIGTQLELGSDLLNGLVAYWTFNEGNGVPTERISGNQATAFTGSWAPTPTGLGIKCGSGWVNLGSSTPWLNVTSAFSIAVLTNVQSTGSPVIYSGWNQSSPYGGAGFRVNAGALNYWSGAKGSWVASNASVVDGNWHVYACSVTGAGGVTFYRDGAAAGTASSNVPNSYTGARAIGAQSGGSNYVSGSISVLAIWNRALSQAEHAAFTLNPWQVFAGSMPTYLDWGQVPAGLIVTPTTASAGDDVPITLTGTLTSWLSTNPTFTVSGGSGASISNISISSNTLATATLYTGTQWGVTLTITDPSTGTSTTIPLAASTVTMTGYVTKNGLACLLFGTNGQPNAVRAINANATISVNGSPVTCQGPFWNYNNGSLGGDDPCVFYQFPTPISGSATVSFSAAAGWVTTTAGPAPHFYSGPIPNYLNSLEPVQFGLLPYNYLPTTFGGLQQGLNIGEMSGAIGPHNVPLNWLRRGGFNNPVGTMTVDSYGHPVTYSGGFNQIAFHPIDNTEGGGNYVDKQNFPDLAGTYTFVADENNPGASAMLAGMTVGSSYTVTSGPTTPSAPNLSSGTLTGGIQVGKAWQWVVTRNANPATLDMGMQITVQLPGASFGNNGTFNYTLSNEWLFPPLGDGGSSTYNGNPTTARANPAAVDPNFYVPINPGNNRGAAVMRFVTPFGGWFSNQVDDSDTLQLNSFNWYANQSGPGTPISVTTIRPYSLATSPNVYFSNQYPGATVNVGGAANMAYQYTPASLGLGIDWCNFNKEYAVAYRSIVLEFVTATTHNLKSGWSPQFTGTMPTLTVTNGSSSTVNVTLPGGSYWGSGSLYVTGPTSFIIILKTTGSTTTTQSGLVMNTMNASQSPSNLFVSAVVPGLGLTGGSGGGIPFEMAANAASGSPACALYVNIPPFYTDAAVTACANRILPYLTAGHKCIVEYGNEVWNNGFPLEDFFYAVGTLGGCNGVSWGISLTDLNFYCVRANTIHNLFKTAFAAAGRSPNDVIGTFGSHSDVSGQTGYIVQIVNAYNAANPGSPIQIDAINVAPYLNCPGTYPLDPSAQATVSATGGGAGGGNLAPGTYVAAYTYIDSVTGMESAIGSSTSTTFTVAAGNIPTITFNDSGSKPSYAGSRNVYLQTTSLLFSNTVQPDSSRPRTGSAISSGSTVGRAIGGRSSARRSGGRANYVTGAPSTSLSLYASGVSLSATTYNCSAAQGAGGAPPANNRLPSYLWATASIAPLSSQAITNPGINPGNPYGSNPWTIPMWCDVMRHHAKYTLQFVGTAAALAGHQTALAGYTQIPGQPAPILICYESQCSDLVPAGIQANLQIGPCVIGQLSHDIFYHPEIYWYELAYSQMMAAGGLKTTMPLTVIGPLQFYAGGFETFQNMLWSAQGIGRGDNSDGKGTNQFSLASNPPVNHNLTNVSVRQQVWQDWAATGNTPVFGPLRSSSAMIAACRVGAGRAYGRAGMTTRNAAGNTPVFGPLRSSSAMIAACRAGARRAYGRAGMTTRNAAPQGQTTAVGRSPIVRSAASGNRRGRLLLPSRTPTPQARPLSGSPIVRSAALHGRQGRVLLPTRTPTPQARLLSGSPIVRSAALHGRQGRVLLPSRTPTPQLNLNVNLIARPMMVRVAGRPIRRFHRPVMSMPRLAPTKKPKVPMLWFPGMSRINQPY